MHQAVATAPSQPSGAHSSARTSAAPAKAAMNGQPSRLMGTSTDFHKITHRQAPRASERHTTASQAQYGKESVSATGGAPREEGRFTTEAQRTQRIHGEKMVTDEHG